MTFTIGTSPMADDFSKFKNLDFEGFKKLAEEPTLSIHEKIGFPNNYRRGKDVSILADIQEKLPKVAQKGTSLLDIGIGCGSLGLKLIEHCENVDIHLTAIDSNEVLKQLPNSKSMTKVAGQFPKNLDFINSNQNRFDSILCYSVFHYIFAKGQVFQFVDAALSMLGSGGSLLIGDIPNISKRKRFFSSPAGIKYHQEFTKTSSLPLVQFNNLESNEIDDSVLLAIVSRARQSGFDAYILKQNDSLPMVNRREDLLITKL